MKNEEARQGIPIYIDQNDPEIDDPANQMRESNWYPANTITSKLMTCVEAIRDIQRLLEILAEQNDPYSDKRIVKLLATPVYNLACGIRDIFNDVEGNFKAYGQVSNKQQAQIKKRFNQFIKNVPLQEGALRTVRDKISSHIDRNVFVGDSREIWGLVDLESLLEWMRACIDALMPLLELDIYAWTRDSGHPDICRLMSVDGVQVDLNLEEKVIIGVSITPSPKFYVSKKIQELATLYAIIKSKCLKYGITDAINNLASPLDDTI